jgi:hypothetical protein
MAHPGHAHALANAQFRYTFAERIDATDDLMTGNDRHVRVGQFPIDDVQIGSAYAAGEDFHPNLAGTGLPLRKFNAFQRLPKRV